MSGLRLLILSAATHVGQNVLASLASRRAGLTLIATSSVANEPALFDFDSVHLVPRTAGDPVGFERALLDVVERERIDVVIPCRDDDVVFCAGLRERVPSLAPRLMCGARAVADVIVDKWSSHEFCRVHGLPFAATIMGTSAAEQAAFVATHGFPLVATPRRGSASMDVYLVHTPTQLARMLARDGYVAQEFLGDRQAVHDYLRALDDEGVPLFHDFQGLKRSMQAIIAPDGSVRAVFNTRRVRQLRRSKCIAVDDDPVAIEVGMRCARAFAASGWRGPLNIQCLMSARGELRIHEFSGRFTGGSMDRRLLGFDEVGKAIEAFVGKTLPFDRAPSGAALEAFESRVGRAADPSQVAALAHDHVWRRVA